MSNGDDAPAIIEYIDAEQRRLRELLSGKDESMLAERPPSGKWSVVENVRHLLFAEQLHLGRFVSGGRQWSTFGLPPHNMRDQKQLRMVGSTPTSSVREVLAAWRAVHAATRELLDQDSEEVRKALQKNFGTCGLTPGSSSGCSASHGERQHPRSRKEAHVCRIG